MRLRHRVAGRAVFGRASITADTMGKPPGLSIGESLHNPSGQWQLAEYGGGFLALTGLLLLMFPKGRW